MTKKATRATASIIDLERNISIRIVARGAGCGGS
jgi:Fe-S cluster assembly iron-binding protein IscA